MKEYGMDYKAKLKQLNLEQEGEKLMLGVERSKKDKYEEVPKWVKKAEFKLDRYNHLMEFMRTFLALCTLTLQIIILLKLFNII